MITCEGCPYTDTCNHFNRCLFMHKCDSHNEWLSNNHYMCSCGHVEWAHYGTRLNKGICAHCNCQRYNGEVRPLTEFEFKATMAEQADATDLKSVSD